MYNEEVDLVYIKEVHLKQNMEQYMWYDMVPYLVHNNVIVFDIMWISIRCQFWSNAYFVEINCH